LFVLIGKVTTMLWILVAMAVVLVLAAAVVGVVVVGLEGRGSDRAPKVAHRLERAGRHLNGEADPPRQLPKPLG